MSIQKLIPVLLVSAVALPGCTVNIPVVQSADAVELSLTTDDFEIIGPTRGETEQFQVLWFGFGEPNSFQRSEAEAIRARNADLIIGRVRLRTFEGLVIPGFPKKHRSW